MTENLIAELNRLLEYAEDKLSVISSEGSDEQFNYLFGVLSHLNNKHIPAEICSEIKLLERITEVEDLIEEIDLQAKSINESTR